MARQRRPGILVRVVVGEITDLQHGFEHVSGIKSIERLTLGEFRLGTKWRETRELLGRLDDAEMEVTAFEHNRSYTISHRKAGVRVDTAFTFEPVPAGTLVSLEFALNPPGLTPALLSPLEWVIAGKVRDVLSHDLLDLKRSIEGVASD